MENGKRACTDLDYNGDISEIWIMLNVKVKTCLRNNTLNPYTAELIMKFIEFALDY